MAHGIFVAACEIFSLQPVGLVTPTACGILVLWPGMEPTSPALEDWFLTTGPPEKPHYCWYWVLISKDPRKVYSQVVITLADRCCTHLDVSIPRDGQEPGMAHWVPFIYVFRLDTQDASLFLLNPFSSLSLSCVLSHLFMCVWLCACVCSVTSDSLWPYGL